MVAYTIRLFLEFRKPSTRQYERAGDLIRHRVNKSLSTSKRPP